MYFLKNCVPNQPDLSWSLHIVCLPQQHIVSLRQTRSVPLWQTTNVSLWQKSVIMHNVRQMMHKRQSTYINYQHACTRSYKLCMFTNAFTHFMYMFGYLRTCFYMFYILSEWGVAPYGLFDPWAKGIGGLDNWAGSPSRSESGWWMDEWMDGWKMEDGRCEMKDVRWTIFTTFATLPICRGISLPLGRVGGIPGLPCSVLLHNESLRTYDSSNCRHICWSAANVIQEMTASWWFRVASWVL